MSIKIACKGINITTSKPCLLFRPMCHNGTNSVMTYHIVVAFIVYYPIFTVKVRVWAQMFYNLDLRKAHQL